MPDDSYHPENEPTQASEYPLSQPTAWSEPTSSSGENGGGLPPSSGDGGSSSGSSGGGGDSDGS